MKGGNGHYFASLIKSCCHLNFIPRAAFHFGCIEREIVVKWPASQRCWNSAVRCNKSLMCLAGNGSIALSCKTFFVATEIFAIILTIFIDDRHFVSQTKLIFTFDHFFPSIEFKPSHWIFQRLMQHTITRQSGNGMVDVIFIHFHFYFSSIILNFPKHEHAWTLSNRPLPLTDKQPGLRWLYCQRVWFGFEQKPACQCLHLNCQ